MTYLRSTLTADAQTDADVAPEPSAQPAASKHHGVAVVTGASSGIGRHLAAQLNQRGYATILIARRAEVLKQACGEHDDRYPSEAFAVDLADADQTRAAIDDVIERWGVPDVLINNAGVGSYQPFLDHDDDDHHRIMRVNYHAAVDLIRATLPGMLQRRRGLIVNVASIATKMAPWGHGPYTASKAALVAMTQTLAAEHQNTGVNFTYVNPGIVRTEYFEKGPAKDLWRHVEKHAIEPDRVARRIVRLIDRPQLELNIPGHYRLLDIIKAVTPHGLHALVTHNSRPR